MPDIFISYSRKDSAHALELAEQLRSSGMDVWIDQHGLELASSWSKDIVDAIEQCKAFVLLLSESSLASHNVVKELSIASDSGRNIIPIENNPCSPHQRFQICTRRVAARSDLRSQWHLPVSGEIGSRSQSTLRSTYNTWKTNARYAKISHRASLRRSLSCRRG